MTTVANRQLTPGELERLAKPLLTEVRTRLHDLCGAAADLLWALRRKLYKELIYDERGKPMLRVALKKAKRIEQADQCALCSEASPERGAVLDRLEAMGGYTPENTRLLCPKCDTAVQVQRGYK